MESLAQHASLVADDPFDWLRCCDVEFALVSGHKRHALLHGCAHLQNDRRDELQNAHAVRYHRTQYSWSKEATVTFLSRMTRWPM